MNLLLFAITRCRDSNGLRKLFYKQIQLILQEVECKISFVELTEQLQQLKLICFYMFRANLPAKKTAFEELLEHKQ